MENPYISEASTSDDLADSRKIGVNDAGTSEPSGTKLAQLRSPGVHGWTYFIRVDDAIKIGFASKPKKRIASLQTSHQKEIETLAIVPAELVDEYKTHQLFAHLRIRGEWFRADRELLYFIEQVKALPVEAPVASEPKVQPPAPVDTAEAMVKRLIAIRAAHGPDTPMGHGCSNLAEQIENMKTYVRPDWAKDERQTLPWMMGWQMKRIETLLAASN